MSTTETKEKTESGGKPEVGVTGRKIVYDKDGKPCRTCNSLLDFQFASGKIKKSPVLHESKKENKPELESYPQDEPPDVTELGKSSWTLLHSIAATYPETPTTKQQQDMKSFINLFSGFYPCWFCAEDFQKYITKNEPKTGNQEELGRWLCEAHNEVNKKLNKPQFNCDLWKKRWKDGWDNEE
ncbi:mitochondrial FAD-linked sulfhydryl oxidase, putative [Candida dubliniensis CD36]|uniref:Sulfhydryl oxidase n=1 Tax=Candida dubliniensis (strain CD36 / ATCC MYA-646 / CBS 7987 / NCPF 3949 / NRRL Y-17841) TaxID=573826 RepID=B9WLA3_CANDC|nr:mitochondrial FAD-linked sulfhydryl oxidase, putative [Candida dubliniensis CD36]CAX39808.1 mitochondrial FAD-linked sulfhydryl oxidase, putative [Candida dubliniensis CD36]